MPNVEIRSLAYSIPLVRMFAAPFSWTTAEPRVGLGARYRDTDASVVPHATPSTMSESNHEDSRRAAVIDTWSRRSMWLAESGTGTT